MRLATPLAASRSSTPTPNWRVMWMASRRAGRCGHCIGARGRVRDVVGLRFGAAMGGWGVVDDVWGGCSRGCRAVRARRQRRDDQRLADEMRLAFDRLAARMAESSRRSALRCVRLSPISARRCSSGCRWLRNRRLRELVLRQQVPGDNRRCATTGAAATTGASATLCLGHDRCWPRQVLSLTGARRQVPARSRDPGHQQAGARAADRCGFGKRQHFVAGGGADWPQRVQLLLTLQIARQGAVPRVLGDEVDQAPPVIGGRDEKDAFITRQTRLGSREL